MALPAKPANAKQDGRLFVLRCPRELACVEAMTNPNLDDVKAAPTYDEWPPMKKAIWNVIMAEQVNDGHYINAWALTEKLNAAAIASQREDVIEEPPRSAKAISDRQSGIRIGIRMAITWLHDRARSMNDPHAQAILNVAASDFGNDLKNTLGGSLAAQPRAEKATERLPYSTPMELFKAFKGGEKFVLHYHGRTFDVSAMEPREYVVYVQPPGLPVKVNPDGSNAEGSSPAIWLSRAAQPRSNRVEVGAGRNPPQKAATVDQKTLADGLVRGLKAIGLDE